MGQLSGFQIEEHEALEQVVVKDQVKVKILRLRADPPHARVAGPG